MKEENKCYFCGKEIENEDEHGLGVCTDESY